MPQRLGITGPMADEIAGQGFVMMSGWPSSASSPPSTHTSDGPPNRQNRRRGKPMTDLTGEMDARPATRPRQLVSRVISDFTVIN